MKTKQAIEIVGQLEDFLNIPSFLCEYLQKELEEEHYQEVIEYIIERKNEDVENQKEKCLKEIERLHSIIKEVREYIEKDTRWFDSEYAKTYGELCTCAGANDTRLEVLVNPSNLLEILDKENI